MAIVCVLNLYTSRIILDQLGIKDYGVYSVVAGVAVIFSFLSSSMASSTQRFLSFEIGKGKEGNINNVFSATIIIHIILGIIIVLLSETIGYTYMKNKVLSNDYINQDMLKVFHISVVMSVISVMQVPFTSFIISNEKMGVFSLLSVLEVVGKLIVALLLSLVDSGEKIYIYSLLLLLLSIIIFILYIVVVLIPFKNLKLILFFDRKVYKDLLSFSGWNIFGNLAVYGKGHGINLVLNLFFSSLINAAYAISMQVNSAVSLFLNSMQIAIGPRIVKSFAQGDIAYVRSLVERFSKYSFLLMTLIILPLCVGLKEILDFWLGVVPEMTFQFVYYTLIALLIDSFSASLMTAVNATGKVKYYQMIIGGAILLNVPLSYMLLKYYPDYGPVSVVYSPIVINVIIFIMRLIFMKHLLSLNIFHYIKNVILPCGFMIALFAGIYNIFDISKLPFIVKLPIVEAILLILIFCIALKRSELSFIKSLIKR